MKKRRYRLAKEYAKNAGKNSNKTVGDIRSESLSKEAMKLDRGQPRSALKRRCERNDAKERFRFGY